MVITFWGQVERWQRWWNHDNFLDQFATSWNNLVSMWGGRGVAREGVSVEHWPLWEKVVLLLALLLMMMTKTRKRKIATIELKPNTAKPATTKLNTSKPTATKFLAAKTTAYKTAFTLLLTDLELVAKLEAHCQTGICKQEAAKPEGLNEVVQWQKVQKDELSLPH